MQECIGVDLHKRSAVIVKKNRRGEITGKAAVPTTAGALAQLLMIYAHGNAQAPVVAVVAYAGIPLSYVSDLLFSDAGASVSSLFGAVLIVAAGVTLARSQPNPDPS